MVLYEYEKKDCPLWWQCGGKYGTDIPNRSASPVQSKLSLALLLFHARSSLDCQCVIFVIASVVSLPAVVATPLAVCRPAQPQRPLFATTGFTSAQLVALACRHVSRMTCPLPASRQCREQPCLPRLLHQLYSFDHKQSDAEQNQSTAPPTPSLASCFNQLIDSLSQLQRRAGGSRQRLAAGVSQLQSLTATTRSLSALQCAGHMQQIASVIERLHEQKIDEFAVWRDEAIRALDVPLMRWTEGISLSCDGGSSEIRQPLISAPSLDVLSGWQELTQHCEDELGAAEEHLRVLEQLLAFCVPTAPSSIERRTHYVHLPVGVFGWQDDRVRISWEQLCETGEHGEQLLAVDITCVGSDHLQLHSLWLTMHCPYTNQLVVRCYPLSSYHLSPSTCCSVPASSPSWSNLWSRRPLSAESSTTSIAVLVAFDAAQFDEDGCALPPYIAISASYNELSDCSIECEPAEIKFPSTLLSLPLPVKRMWWRRPNHALEVWKDGICPSATYTEPEEESEPPNDPASDAADARQSGDTLSTGRMCTSS